MLCRSSNRVVRLLRDQFNLFVLDRERHLFRDNDRRADLPCRFAQSPRSIVMCDRSCLYDEKISNPKITKLARSARSDSACWVYSMRVKDREAFSQFMTENGVQTGRLHVRNDTYSCFARFRAEQLPGVDVFDRELIHIPAGPHLLEIDKNEIIDLVNAF